MYYVGVKVIQVTTQHTVEKQKKPPQQIEGDNKYIIIMCRVSVFCIFNFIFDNVEKTKEQNPMKVWWWW